MSSSNRKILVISQEHFTAHSEDNAAVVYGEERQWSPAEIRQLLARDEDACAGISGAETPFNH